MCKWDRVENTNKVRASELFLFRPFPHLSKYKAERASPLDRCRSILGQIKRAVGVPWNIDQVLIEDWYMPTAGRKGIKVVAMANGMIHGMFAAMGVMTVPVSKGGTTKAEAVRCWEEHAPSQWRGQAVTQDEIDAWYVGYRTWLTR